VSNGLQTTIWTVTPSLPHSELLSEWEVFRLLDTLRPTATAGLDQITAWFLKIAAPLFCKPLANRFNLSIVTSTVPAQWKPAHIRPAAEVVSPDSHADFRLITITPVLQCLIGIFATEYRGTCAGFIKNLGEK